MQLPPQISQARAFAAGGRGGEAVQLLMRLAQNGDGPACYELAEWHREGALVPRDFAAARALYRRAGEAGLIEGWKRHIALVATGVGGPRAWGDAVAMLGELGRFDPTAKGQHDLLGAMQLTSNGDPVQVGEPELLHESPRLLRFAGFFTAAECAYLADAAAPLFEPANTVEEQTLRQVRNPIRTSETAVFPWVGENPAIHALNRRMAAASGTDWAQGEPLQVLRYQPGQEYKAHIDAVPGLANQRIMTMLVYLNDGYQGGETRFPQLGQIVSGRRGDAILFDNLDAEGRPNPVMTHAGLPVTRGTKLLASRWIRAQSADA